MRAGREIAVVVGRKFLYHLGFVWEEPGRESETPLVGAGIPGTGAGVGGGPRLEGVGRTRRVPTVHGRRPTFLQG